MVDYIFIMNWNLKLKGGASKCDTYSEFNASIFFSRAPEFLTRLSVLLDPHLARNSYLLLLFLHIFAISHSISLRFAPVPPPRSSTFFPLLCVLLAVHAHAVFRQHFLTDIHLLFFPVFQRVPSFPRLLCAASITFFFILVPRKLQVNSLLAVVPLSL